LLHCSSCAADDFSRVCGSLFSVHSLDGLDDSLLHVSDPLSATLCQLAQRLSLLRFEAKFPGRQQLAEHRSDRIADGVLDESLVNGSGRRAARRSAGRTFGSEQRFR
jgi:hypothetical protein